MLEEKCRMPCNICNGDWERELETKLIQQDLRLETEQEIATRLAEESVGYCE